MKGPILPFVCSKIGGQTRKTLTNIVKIVKSDGYEIHVYNSTRSAQASIAKRSSCVSRPPRELVRETMSRLMKDYSSTWQELADL
jgi:hypothetical protein